MWAPGTQAADELSEVGTMVQEPVHSLVFAIHDRGLQWGKVDFASQSRLMDVQLVAQRFLQRSNVPICRGPVHSDRTTVVAVSVDLVKRVVGHI